MEDGWTVNTWLGNSLGWNIYSGERIIGGIGFFSNGVNLEKEFNLFQPHYKVRISFVLWRFHRYFFINYFYFHILLLSTHF